MERLNYAYVVLLPKVEGAISLSKLQTINSLNVVYRIVTIVLTVTLNYKLDRLIDKSHSGFIKGRYILDGVVAAQELISHCLETKLVEVCY